jgi:hypothetical protein
MKEFFIALIVAAALLIPFRKWNGGFQLSDVEGLAHLCTEGVSRLSDLRP